MDAALGRRAGEYLRRYRKSHAVELGHALIAASAVERGARLWISQGAERRRITPRKPA